MIELKDVSWQRKGKSILKEVSWKVKSSEHWCLVGLNGSGKTTLLKMINGYIWPTSGTVTVLGNTFGTTNVGELRKKIGWVSSSLQQRLPENETAEMIVLSGKFATIGLYEQVVHDDLQKADELLTILGCEHLKERTYATLSQGERQRILIARALMASPQLLILDEPCTGLDLFAREHLLGFIDKATKQPDSPTFIYVTHHVEEILPCFTHTLLMKQGEVFASGKTKEVLTPEQLTAFFDAPVAVQQNKEKERISISLK
ncbi:ABC transporter ATP-binding protein [Bacillus chungangensis]|uniref:Iron complex transport system ATP-binding protein n=1 Tax=Bacillus chungangensis TaxID=587633 RepID=A0ABT9WRP7_9BACI|nr:ABC transporter ATP-binding protein [Bacillus chungangensis]MDQ0175887.1 iron complex transport system ATP-binding protein [Bacillus chungangensis]